MTNFDLLKLMDMLCRSAGEKVGLGIRPIGPEQCPGRRDLELQVSTIALPEIAVCRYFSIAELEAENDRPLVLEMARLAGIIRIRRESQATSARLERMHP